MENEAVAVDVAEPVKPAPEEEKKLMRTLNLDVWIDEKGFEKKNAVVDDVNAFRRACGQLAGLVYMMDFACAKKKVTVGEVMSLKPSPKPRKPNANGILLPMPPQDGNEFLHKYMELARDHKLSAATDFAKQLLSEKTDISSMFSDIPWMADMAGQVQRLVWRRWTSKDAEIPKCRRNWLALNLERKFPMFKRQGIPIRGRDAVCRDYEIELQWRKGNPVVFKLGELDPVRRGTWFAIKKNGWNTCILNVRRKKGKQVLTISVTYEVERNKIESLEREHCLEVATGDEDEKFFSMRMVEGQKTVYEDMFVEFKNVSAIVAWLDGLSVHQDKLKSQLEGCGLNNKVYRVLQGRRDKVTLSRDNGVKTWNHVWTKAIIREALRNNCGRVRAHLPAKLLKRQWQWSDFEFKLKYKAEQVGIEVEVIKEKDADDKQEGKK